MKFGTPVLLGFLLAAGGSTSCCAAFSINPHKTAVQKALSNVVNTACAQQKQEATASLRAPMNMVAGGAERAYGDDYYDGACVID